jgi:hypothetical protein
MSPERSTKTGISNKYVHALHCKLALGPVSLPSVALRSTIRENRPALVSWRAEYSKTSRVAVQSEKFSFIASLPYFELRR